MSILLDAVSKSQQQHNQDPLSAPRPLYKTAVKRNYRPFYMTIAALIAGTLAGAGTAYGVAVYQQSKTFVATVNENSNVKGLAQDSVQLAQTVALPAMMAAPVITAVPEPKPVMQATSQHSAEPVILGANANEQGKALLASLQNEVQQAAKDVGLSTKTEVTKVETQAKQIESRHGADNNLLAAFEQALKEVEAEKSVAKPVTKPKLDPIPATPKDTIPSYGQLPAGVQLQVPEFNINAHVYASDPSQRWLNVDGQELQQGDKINGKLDIIEIRPRDIVLAIDGYQFKVPAVL